MPERDARGRFPKGNGSAGQWGGPKKGEGSQVDLAEVRHLRWDADNLAQKEEVAAEMRAVLYNVARFGEAEAARINAADKLLDRIEGKATQRSEVSGKEGGAIRIERVIIDPHMRNDADG
jgi:hypothetical protein